MLDKLPKEVWSNPDLKWFDPAVGVGNFMIFVYYRLMENLKTSFPDDIERKAHIIKNMLYMSELNPVNIKECIKIFGNELNIYEGDTLKMDTFDVFGINQFDIIVGNPPFNSSGAVGTGNTIWQLFVKLSLDTWLNKNGYLVYVHPSSWRKPNTVRSRNFGLYKLMTKNNTILYLEIHDSKDGLKTFKAGTRYDWYVIKRAKNNNYKTINKLGPSVFNKNYNIFTNCLPSNTNFINNCKNKINSNNNNIKAVEIMGYDCLPGFKRAKCII